MTRTTLLSTCCAVSVEPAVCAWNRIIIERSSFAPKRSFMSRAHIRRAARNLAISSKKLLWTLKKNDSRLANPSISSPALIAASTYAIPSAIVKASSCAAVEPASRMW